MYPSTGSPKGSFKPAIPERNARTPQALGNSVSAGDSTEKKKFEARGEARQKVGDWVSQCSSKAYAHVVSEQLIAQITTGVTELILARPTNTVDKACLNGLELPDGFSIKLEEVAVDASSSSSESSSSPGSSTALHPLSPHRSYMPQGGMVRMPLQELTQAQKEDLQPLVVAFFDNAKSTDSTTQRKILVSALFTQVENKAATHRADAESFQFELASQLADRSRKLGNNKPLRDILPHLPQNWRHLFEHDSESKEGWQDYRALMGSVARGREHGQPAEIEASNSQHLPAAGNEYMLAVIRQPENPVAAAQVLVQKIRRAARSPGGESKLIESMFSQLNNACARAENLAPLYAFVSTLEPHYREIYSQRLPAKPVSQSAKLIDKLVAPNSSVMKGEFEKFAQSRNAIQTMISGVAKKDKSEAAQLQSKLDFAVTGVARGWIRDLGSRDSPLHQNDFNAFHIAFARVTGLIGRLDEASQAALVNELNQTLEKLATTVPGHAQAVRHLKL